MKGGLTAYWAVQAVRRSGVQLRGTCCWLGGEEDGGLGTFATLQRGWGADVRHPRADLAGHHPSQLGR